MGESDMQIKVRSARKGIVHLNVEAGWEIKQIEVPIMPRCSWGQAIRLVAPLTPEDALVFRMEANYRKQEDISWQSVESLILVRSSCDSQEVKVWADCNHLAPTTPWQIFALAREFPYSDDLLNKDDPEPLQIMETTGCEKGCVGVLYGFDQIMVLVDPADKISRKAFHVFELCR